MKKITVPAILLLFFSFRLLAQDLDTYQDAKTSAQALVAKLGLIYNKKLNVFTGTGPNDDVIHIFMYQDGNLCLTGYPTAATEKSKFALHILYSSATDNKYLLEYTGSYAPALNIVNATPPVPAAVRGVPPPPAIIKELDFAVIGPFTGSLILTVKKSDGTDYNTLATTTIAVAKTIHVSIGSGIVFTTLKDPSNIKKVPLAGTDSTLLADNSNGRSLLTIMATFYPWGRNNLLIPEWNDFKNRFGIVAGTTLGSGTSTFKNLIVGAQYDFAVGGSFVAGLHLGQRQRIKDVDYGSFKFGTDKFDGNLENKKYTQTDVGFFLGIALDTRIFSQILK